MTRISAVLAAAFLAIGSASADCPKRGGGHAGGSGGPGGRGGHGESGSDHQGIYALLSNRDAVTRTVKKTEHGVETLTESDDPAVAEQIRTHVQAMYRRVESGDPIHQRDPLFRAIFANVDKIHMVMEPTAKGVRVVESSIDPYVVKLIQAHADVVDAFIANGHSEMMRNHPVPERD